MVFHVFLMRIPLENTLNTMRILVIFWMRKKKARGCRLIKVQAGSGKQQNPLLTGLVGE
jgi:hypothetical protein